MSALGDVELFPFRVPMRLPFRQVTEREGVLVRGPAGWGEFSPFATYPPEVTCRWLAAALEAACTPMPPPLRTRVPVNVTVPAVDPETARGLVAESGCATAKVKVGVAGRPFEEDLARVEAVRDALGPGGRVRIDVNGAWTLDEAVDRLTRLSSYGLEYAEQPVMELADLVELRRRTEVPIAVDEAVRLAPNPMAVVDAGAADLVVLKAQPMGGVHRLLDFASRAGVPAVVSSALETSVGLAVGLSAAASLPELSFACGLATGALLSGDVVDEPLVPIGGEIEVRRPEPSSDLLARWRPDRATESRVMHSLRLAADLLT